MCRGAPLPQGHCWAAMPQASAAAAGPAGQHPVPSGSAGQKPCKHRAQHSTAQHAQEQMSRTPVQLPHGKTSADMLGGRLTPALPAQHTQGTNCANCHSSPAAASHHCHPRPTDAHLESAGLWCVFHTLLVMNSSPRLPAARNSARPLPTTDSLP